MKIPGAFLILFAGLFGLLTEADSSTHVFGAKKKVLDPANDAVSAGYYEATTLSVVDPDLESGNIRGGVVIFGKLGTYATGYAVPDSGQTGDFTATFGEDSDYQPIGAQPSYTVYNPVGVSSVTVDNRTGLMWVTNTVDAGMGGTYVWESAIIACESLNYGTYTDWRLPNIREIKSIRNYQSYSVPPAYFNAVPGVSYWSSTTIMSLRTRAITDVGYADKPVPLYVRCVRAGP